MKSSKYFIFFVLVFSCIEPYDFAISDEDPALVVEGFISDKSFSETIAYPSDGRYFKIRLSYTSNVDNIRTTPATAASISLLSESGNNWTYEEVADEPGNYELRDENFEAIPGMRYKLKINSGEESFESDWEKLPDAPLPSLGDIQIVESTKQVYVMIAEEPQLQSVKVATVNILVPERDGGEEVHHKWSYQAIWKYRAPLSRSLQDPGNTCWIPEKEFLANYELQTDRQGGYRKDLFTFRTIRNVRIYEDLSVLIVHHILSPDQYAFFKEMKDQNEPGTFVQVPPFSLKTNIHGVNTDRRTSGYFTVAKEQAIRWWFNRKDLSYHVVNTLKRDCELPDLPPGPECFDCREYPFGIPTNVKPAWWR